MTIEFFIEKFQTFRGIMELLQDNRTEDILQAAGEIFERPMEDLTDYKLECLGSSGARSPYAEVLKELKRSIVFWGRFYDALADEISRAGLLSMMKYWLLPDQSFLQDASDAEAGRMPDQKKGADITLQLSGIDDICENTEAIKRLGYSEAISVTSDDALHSLWIIKELLTAVRDDLIFRLHVKDMKHVGLSAICPRPGLMTLRGTGRQIRVASIAKSPGEWTNEELLKDKGLIPYFLHKLYGFDSVMVGEDNGSYDYLEKYLPGMRMEFLPDGRPETRNEWLLSNAKDIDILIVNGPYPVNRDIVRIYKEQNPHGLTYMPLDANSEWIDRLTITDEETYRMLSLMDVIGTSGRKLQRHLNRKWPWRIRYFPNGYYHPWVSVNGADYHKKENIILTVGRIGDHQKGTTAMLQAFARIFDRIPGWTLRLVGNITDTFRPCIEDYFNEHPELRDRVIFVGKITDKAALFEEYKRAKIFTLTSILEGGTPNVVAEGMPASS